ncbi:MAG: hypothetical protein ACK5CU_04435 [Rhodoluna sp.]|jgi:uncharacterized protein YdhG (YjbR/CyaY superfamily)
MPKKQGLSQVEKDAIAARAKEASRARGKDPAVDLAEVMAKYKEMPKEDREMGLRLHELITKTAPELFARTWYGMPAYYTPGKDGKVIFFFQSGSKFKIRYSTVGFSEHAKLDSGAMWPTSFALVKLTKPVESQIKKLLLTALGK